MSRTKRHFTLRSRTEPLPRDAIDSQPPVPPRRCVVSAAALVDRLNGSLPFAAIAFRGKIEQTIRDELEKVLRA